jgi:hypothetical protein
MWQKKFTKVSPPHFFCTEILAKLNQKKKKRKKEK